MPRYHCISILMSYQIIIHYDVMSYSVHVLIGQELVAVTFNLN
jgi:hypothetical protein